MASNRRLQKVLIFYVIYFIFKKFNYKLVASHPKNIKFISHLKGRMFRIIAVGMRIRVFKLTFILIPSKHMDAPDSILYEI